MIIIETPYFAKRRDDRLEPEEYRHLQNSLVVNPRYGQVIPGSNGLRKMRLKSNDRGASRGLRVIYFYIEQKDRIFLLDIYAKNEKSDLTKSQLKELAGLIELFKEFEYSKRH